MWLIDAEELILKHSYMLTECEHGAFPMVVDVDDICNAPAVEAEPVKHAHWDIDFPCGMNPNYPDYVCSSCGMHSWAKTKYCPNCGAKMYVEGEKHGED